MATGDGNFGQRRKNFLGHNMTFLLVFEFQDLEMSWKSGN